MPRLQTSFLFDLDGTLVDSVYQHVLAWRDALDEEGIELSVWRIHRKIGMSGGLLHQHAAARDRARHQRGAQSTGCASCTPRRISSVARKIPPLPGAKELLAYLSEANIPWAIATSGRMETARPVPREAGRRFRQGAGRHARPGEIREARPGSVPGGGRSLEGRHPRPRRVVGDSIWDMLAARRASALGIGLLSGGYGAGRA